MGRQEFEDCMEHLNINTFKNSDYYPIRLKKEYADLWKCHQINIDKYNISLDKNNDILDKIISTHIRQIIFM